MSEELSNKANVSNAVFLTGDLRELPFLDNSFNLIVCQSVLEHVIGVFDEIFGEVGRILKRGGIFLFTAKKVEKLSKLKVKAAQLLWPILPNSFKEKHEFGVETFHTRLDHSKRTIRELAKRHGFNVQEIEIKVTIYEVYFVCAEKGFK